MSEPAKWKVELVNEITNEINNSEVAAIVSITGLRNKEFQKIRNDLRSDAKIQVLRTRLLKRAIQNSNKTNIGKLVDLTSGQIALLTTGESPKSIYDKLESKRTMAAARGGEIAEEDIIIEPKETNFPPGPMITVFQKVGIQAGIEKGKIVIKSEVTFVKKGEVIRKDKAQVLEKLEILPVTVGLDLISAYQDGIVFNRDVLSITLDSLINDLSQAFFKAKHLALDITYLVPEIVPELMQKAFIQGQALSLESNFVDEKYLALYLRKAAVNASTLNALTNKDLNNETIRDKPEEKKEEKKENSSEEDAASGLGSLFG